MVLIVPQTIEHRIVGLILNGEFESMWNELAVAKFEAFSWRGVRKTARNLRIFGIIQARHLPNINRESLRSLKKSKLYGI
jgi:hypothetical protein